MENKNQILDIFKDKLSMFLGNNYIKEYNNLYNGLFYYITCCVNHDGDIGSQYDLCITFLTILKESIDEVLFPNEE